MEQLQKVVYKWDSRGDFINLGWFLSNWIQLHSTSRVRVQNSSSKYNTFIIIIIIIYLFLLLFVLLLLLFYFTTIIVIIILIIIIIISIIIIIIRVKYVFGPSSLSEIWVQSLIKTFDQFSPSSFKMYEFSPFNQILLSLSDISSAFHDSI